jgi:hypothetical protein
MLMIAAAAQATCVKAGTILWPGLETRSGH